MKPMIRLFIESDVINDPSNREYFRYDKKVAALLVKDATDATEKDGIIRRVGYEISRD